MKCPYCDGTGDLPIEKAHVGLFIQAARKAKRKTQDEVASAAGLSRAQVANIECGRSDLPVSRLRKIADFLEVPMRELVP